MSAGHKCGITLRQPLPFDNFWPCIITSVESCQVPALVHEPPKPCYICLVKSSTHHNHNHIPLSLFSDSIPARYIYCPWNQLFQLIWALGATIKVPFGVVLIWGPDTIDRHASVVHSKQLWPGWNTMFGTHHLASSFVNWTWLQRLRITSNEKLLQIMLNASLLVMLLTRH